MVKSAGVHGDALDWLLNYDTEEDREMRGGRLSSDLMAYSGANKHTKSSKKKGKKKNVSSRNRTRKH